MFWRPAKANCAIVARGVCCMEISRSLGSPRKANGFMVVILLPSSESFFKKRRPAKASLLMTGKLFLVSAKFSTVCGRRLDGISCRPPVLQRT